MALHNVPESDSFDTNVQMPADGDSADSSDFESTTIRPLTNRTRYLKNLLALLQVLRDGGDIETTDDVNWTIADNKSLKIQSDSAGADNGEIDLEDVYTRFAGFVTGHLFEANASGQANYKRFPTTITSSATIDVSGYNHFRASGSTMSLTIAAGTFPDGSWFVVRNIGSAAVTVEKPGGGAIFIIPASSPGAWAEFVYDKADDLWSVARSYPLA